MDTSEKKINSDIRLNQFSHTILVEEPRTISFKNKNESMTCDQPYLNIRKNELTRELCNVILDLIVNAIKSQILFHDLQVHFSI